MVKFLDRIICYSILEEGSNDISDETLSTLSSKTDQEFILKLEWDINVIDVKTQLYSYFHNAPCFKYGVADLKQCQFDFPQSQIIQTVVFKQEIIDIY